LSHLIAVFCGSSLGKNPIFAQLARDFGQILIERKMGLVYGGASIGIMGVIAESVLQGGGAVVGVIPKFLEKREVGHKHLTEKITVDSMHERKQIMYQRAQSFVIFPGGMGTLDEFFEILTWKQLALHDKPIVIFNPQGFFDPLLRQIDLFLENGFVSPEHSKLFTVCSTLDELKIAI
jgi:uncharacterized protein (TIGR00730 family)